MGLFDTWNQDIVDEYGLDDYDDTEQDEGQFKSLLGIGDLAEYADPSQDPYIDLNIPEDEQEDLDDFMIRLGYFLYLEYSLLE